MRRTAATHAHGVLRGVQANVCRGFSSSVDLFSVSKLADAFQSNKVSSQDVTLATIHRADSAQHLNCFITLCAQAAMQQAKEADERRSAGNTDCTRLCKGILDGVPISVKDNFCTKGVLTTAASGMLRSFVPPYDATVVRKLRDAGAVIVGKTNMDEFSMGSANNSGYFGRAVNPWSFANSRSDQTSSTTDGRSGDHQQSPPDTALTPGGSSGGSAAAVAARLSWAALGTDTGGSIRLPASYCGTVGFKPSYGLVSRFGLIAYASSLDTPSVTTRSVDDAWIMFAAMAGADPQDSTSRDAPDSSALKRLLEAEKVQHVTSRLSWLQTKLNAADGPLKGLRVGIPLEYHVAELPPDIVALWSRTAQLLKAAGAELVTVSVPAVQHALPAYYIIATAEAASNLARYDGVRFGASEASSPWHPTKQTAEMKDLSLDELYRLNRSAGFGSEVQRRILVGNFVMSSESYATYVTKAQQVRRRIAQDFASVFSVVDVLLTPTAPGHAPSFDELEGAYRDNPVSMYLNDVMTIPSNLVGLPAISVPAGLSAKGLPLGMQLIGKRYHDHEVLLAAAALEQGTQFQYL